MSSRSIWLAAALGLAAIAAAPACGAAQPANAGCFLSTQWEGWKSPAPTVIYLRVQMHDVYRVDLSAPAYDLDAGDVHLVSKIRGSDWICNPLDLDLALADDHGVFREPLLVKSITKLTPDEIAAIPPKFRP